MHIPGVQETESARALDFSMRFLPNKSDCWTDDKRYNIDINEKSVRSSASCANTPKKKTSRTMATACPTTSFHTTSAPYYTSKPMATTARTSTNSSAEDCVKEAGRNTTSTRAGDGTGCQFTTKHTPPPPISLQTSKSKRDRGSASLLSDSSIHATSRSSLLCAKRKKKTRKRRLSAPTENHLKLRNAIDAGEKWEVGLEQIHGLTDEEACVCVSIVTKHLHDETLPPSNGNRLMELAREGWKTLKEVDRLVKLYPECGNQDKIDGKWVMFHVKEAGRNTSTRAGDGTGGQFTTKHTPPPPISLQTSKSKRDRGPASLSYSSINATSSSSLCAKKRKTRKRRLPAPMENHLKLRNAIDAGETWEVGLEQIHGLTDEEACVCVSIVTKHLHDETLPPSNGNRLMELAREGWKTLKEVDRLVKLYPECGNQDKIDGKWVMFHVKEAGRNTSTRAGDGTGGQFTTKHTPPPPISLQTSKSKRDRGSASLSSDSSIHATSRSSLLCAKRKKKTRKRRLSAPTENHLKLRNAIDAGETWEVGLEQIHGLTDEEACVCVSIVTKHLHDETLPPSNGNRLMELAREGWKTLKQVDRLVKLYPECGNQDKIDGKWVMFHVKEAGRNTSTRAGDGTGGQFTKHTAPPPISLQTSKSKRDRGPASLSYSSINATSSSSLCAKKRKTRKRRLPAPMENHLKLRNAIDAGETWEVGLEQIHGLTDEEACVCVSIVTKHLHDETLPPSNGNRLMELAREGWKTLKEVDRLVKLYPECGNQGKIDGKWVMFHF